MTSFNSNIFWGGGPHLLAKNGIFECFDQFLVKKQKLFQILFNRLIAQCLMIIFVFSLYHLVTYNTRYEHFGNALQMCACMQCVAACCTDPVEHLRASEVKIQIARERKFLMLNSEYF